MRTVYLPSKQRSAIINILIDIAALGFIYLVPTISHLLSLPFYLIEPMRLMLVIALVHTSKNNAYLLALTLPLFSFLVSAHPALPKMILISFELALNVFLFFQISKKIKHIFPAILLSIVISKLAYYMFKFGMIELAILNSGLISTSILIQVIMTFVFSGYVYLFYKNKSRNS